MATLQCFFSWEAACIHVIARTWMGSTEYSRKERPDNNHPWISRLVYLGVIGWKFLCPFSGGHYERVLWREALQKLAGFSSELHGTYLGVNVFVGNLDWWLKGRVTSPKRKTFCICLEWDLSQKSWKIRLEKYRKMKTPASHPCPGHKYQRQFRPDGSIKSTNYCPLG